MSNNIDAATVAALSPPHVGAYLRMQGWMDRGPFGANGRLYARAAQDDGGEVVLPTRTSISDFAKRMAELVDDLAHVEQRSASSVLFDLTLAPFDVLRIRSRDADEYGSVRFAEGLLLGEEALNLLVASARAASADVARRAWKGRRPEVVNAYLQRVRLGQTEKRSFSLTVLSPYAFDPAQHSQVSFFDKDAYGRQITRKFASALAAIEGALVEGVSNPMQAFEGTVQAGVSAELCDALGNLADNDVGVEVSLSWSPAKPVAERVSLSLSPRDAAVLKEVAREFSRQEPEPDARIEGIVTGINEDPRTFDGSTVVEAAVEVCFGVE